MRVLLQQVWGCVFDQMDVGDIMMMRKCMLVIKRRAEQAEERLASLTHGLGMLRGEYDALRCEHDLLQGSLRTFLRGYLPRLRRHALGQRP